MNKLGQVSHPPKMDACHPSWRTNWRALGIFSLFFVLWDRVRRHQSIESWPFSKLRTHWLYDEVDVAPIGRGMFLHRVLLSDGTVIEIPFVSALIHNFPLQAGRQSDASRQIA